MASQKPLRDWLYLSIIGVQLFGMLALDLVGFYPKQLYQPPSSPLHFLVRLRAFYAASSGDPYYQARNPAAAHEPWFQALLYIEALVQLPLAAYLVHKLASRRPASGPVELAGLAFGCLTAMGSATCCMDILYMGPRRLGAAQKNMLLYGTYLPFAVIPALMAVDMFIRLLTRVQDPVTRPKTAVKRQ